VLPSALLPSAPSLLSLPPLSDSLSELQMSTSLLLSELLLPELPSELLSSVPPGALPLLGELLSSEAVCDIELLSELSLSLKGEIVEAPADTARGRLRSHEPKSEKSFV
jgi:hypothetical protein